MRRYQGFTLIELVIVMVLIAVIAAWAIPSFTRIVADNSLVSAGNSVVGFLNEARGASIQQGRSVIVAPLNGTSWASGMEAWVDNDYSNSINNADTPLYIQQPLGSAVRITSGPTTLQFLPSGLIAGATTPTPFKLCSTTSGVSGTQISLTIGGQVSTSKVTCP